MNKLIYLLALLLLFSFSCSKEDEDVMEEQSPTEDFVIGSWRMIEFYENDVSTYSACHGFHYDKFSEDSSLISIGFGTAPYITITYCLEYPESEWTWTSIGNQQFELKLDDNPEEVYTIYMEGENLVKEYPDGVSKAVYEPVEID